MFEDMTNASALSKKKTTCSNIKQKTQEKITVKNSSFIFPNITKLLF